MASASEDISAAASTPTSPDIDEQIEARLAPYEDSGTTPAPLVLAQVEC